MTGGTILRADRLRVRNERKFRIEIESLEVAEGETLGIIGPNGAGKTTLLLSLAGLKKPESGAIFFRGEPLDASGSVIDYRRRVSMVFQEPLLLNATVFDNVAMGLRIRKMKGAELSARVSEYCELFGIGGLLRRRAKTLSGGEAQRVSLARAMAVRPDILLLDEPFSSLDLPTRESLLADFEEILAKTRATALLATHDRAEAIRLSRRLAVMSGGRLVRTGTPAEVMNDPSDEFVASFVGVETLLEARVEEANETGFFARAGSARIEVAGTAAAREEVILGIRPENVILSAGGGPGATSMRNSFRGRITGAVNLGAHYRVKLDCGFPLVAYVTPRSWSDLGLAEGSEVTASFKATAVHLVRRSSPDA
ncbi:MAG: ABC transporter ATP-binding protein [Spirochaetes bacterium]|nr:ABC transporter ATP-binding protein [Spirochaetota bacterium]